MITVELKFNNLAEVRQLRNVISDYCGYLYDLRRRYLAVTDMEEDILDLTEIQLSEFLKNNK